MSAGRLDPPPAAETDSQARPPGLASTCLGAAFAVAIVGGWGTPPFVLVSAGLAGGSVGAALSIAVERNERRPRRVSSESDRPWFHRVAAAGALGIATMIVLSWAAVLEATIPGYGAATTAGLLSYALLASVLPGW